MVSSDVEAPTLSVIIPTRNRVASLRETLDGFARQETAGAFTYELLVVDNGSTDGTREMIEGLRAAFPVALRYVYEARCGIPWARNAGLRHSRGSILVMADDDVVTTPGLLQAFWSCFLEERADGVTGRTLPLWSVPRPAWFTDELIKRGETGCMDRGPSRLRSTERRNCRWVGGNMAIRRDVIDRVGLFDTRMLRGEDTDYYTRCVGQGLKVVYEPQAIVYHKIGADRTTPAYFRRWRRMTGSYHAYALPWRKYHLITVMPASWYRHTLGFAMGWLRKWITRRPWIERFQDEMKLHEHAGMLGRRLTLWPRWCLTVLSGRSYLP